MIKSALIPAVGCQTRVDIGDYVIEVRQDKFVLANDPGGVKRDAGQIDEVMVVRVKKRRAPTA
jgi:hypothetical protein